MKIRMFMSVPYFDFFYEEKPSHSTPALFRFVDVIASCHAGEGVVKPITIEVENALRIIAKL